jgi:phosphoenolpyruvate-protein phosphotransferase (PTS system enzyme I)
MILQGRCVSPGLAQGRSRVLDEGVWLSSALNVPAAAQPEVEAERLHAAIGRACQQLDRLRKQLASSGHGRDAEIFAAHMVMLKDAQFQDRMLQRIVHGSLSAEAAVAQEVMELHRRFTDSRLPVIQDKVADVSDIGRRLIRCLNQQNDGEAFGADVVVASSVTPSELVNFAHQKVAAVVTETCGLKSHTAILARGLGVPMIAGIASATEVIPDGTMVLVDAAAGTLVFDASEDERGIDQQIRERLRDSAARTIDLAPRVSRDGVPVDLLLNISIPIEAESVTAFGAAGVGLFRTEFLYMHRDWWPTEAESLQAYEQVAAAIGDAELQIRLADFGAEKSPPYADIPINRNPSLGIRGIRLLLQHDEILRPQVRAVAEIARRRPVTLLLPMLDTLDTLLAVKDKLCQLCDCPDRTQLPFRVGAMIEVPAAAVTIEMLIDHVDAVSVGLNDLTQYVLAADRDDELMEAYHDPLQPAVLHLVRRVVRAAHRQGKPVTMCGELAGDLQLATALLALGVRRFSVSRSHFQDLAAAIAQIDVGKLAQLGAQLLRTTSGKQIRLLLTQNLSESSVAR